MVDIETIPTEVLKTDLEMTTQNISLSDKWEKGIFPNYHKDRWLKIKTIIETELQKRGEL